MALYTSYKECCSQLAVLINHCKMPRRAADCGRGGGNGSWTAMRSSLSSSAWPVRRVAEPPCSHSFLTYQHRMYRASYSVSYSPIVRGRTDYDVPVRVFQQGNGVGVRLHAETDHLCSDAN